MNGSDAHRRARPVTQDEQREQHGDPRQGGTQGSRPSVHPVYPVHPCSTSVRRRGVVLVIVVGILAVMMLMAGTLALLSRVGHQMSVSYDYSQALDGLSDAVETYAMDILHRDKYGTDGMPYGYEVAQAQGFLGGAYPNVTNRNYYDDDEGFDSHLNEEWLPNPGWAGGTPDPPGLTSWRLFPGRPYNAALWQSGAYGTRVDLDGDTNLDGNPFEDNNDWMVEWRRFRDLGPTLGGRAELTGADATARVSLYYEDLGGARIDVNAAGNTNAPGGANAQNQGLTPFEADLDAIRPGLAAAVILGIGPLVGRLGTDGVPNGATDWMPPGVDIDADGTIGADPNGDPTAYSPIWPAPSGDDAPFDNFDLNDLFQMTDTGSRVAAILTAPAVGIPLADFYLFTTQSAGTSLAARPTATIASFSVVADTMPMLNQPFFSRGSGNALPSKRPLNEIVTQLSPRELADFLESLDPVVQAEGILVTPADRRRILRQVATNLKDMVDPDPVVSVWTDENHDTYCGVEVTPYVAEGEVAVPTWYNVLADTPATETLPTAPGKYIKLINPWNVDIPLADYRLVLPHEYPAGSGVPRLREWVYVPAGEHHTRIAVPRTSDVVLDWPTHLDQDGTPDNTDVVPARGHYVIAENLETLQVLTATDPLTLDRQFYTVEPGLAYMQECIGRPLGTEDEYKFLRTNPPGAFGWNDPIYAWDPPAGSGATATVLRVGPDNVVLVMHDNQPAPRDHFSNGEQLFDIDPDLNPGASPRATAVGVDEPIYDWFENPPDTALTGFPPSDVAWLQAWLTANPGSPVAQRVGQTENGRASALQLFQVGADSPIMFTVLPDTSVASADDDEDDWPLVTTTLSGQMDDPRPCWVRRNEASGFQSAQAPGPTVNNPGPWGRNAWDRLSKQTAGTWDPGDTANPALPASWFNTNWAWSTARHDASRGINTGDGWNVLYDPAAVPITLQEDDIRYSFPPVDPTTGDGWNAAVGVAEYTNVQNHHTAAMNLGLLSSPGDIGFVHAGMPWTTVSLGDYGQEDLVYLREFLDYIAAPIGPYESRDAHVGHSEFRLGRGARVGNGAMHSVAGDFDGDGFLDVAVAAAADSMVNVLYGGPGGVLGGRLDYAVGASPQGIVTADFDLDGRLDLAVVNYSDQDVSVLYGQVGGGFGGRLDLPIGNDAEGIVAADLNGDGRPDLAAVNRSDGTLSVLYSLPAGGFTPQSIYLIGSGHFWPVAGDFNGDGRLDLATAGDSTLTVYYQLSGGGFGGRQDYVVGPGPGPGITDIATADFNRDGRLDFALANEGNGYVTVLYGQVGGGFGTPSNSPAVSFPMRLSVGDFNGDGLPDVAAGSPGSSSLTFLFCATNGTLTAGRRDYSFGTPSNDMAVGDFSADGALDLALPFDALDEVAVFVNTGAAARTCGQVNVNTAPAEVLQAAMKQAIAPPPLLPGDMAAMAASWIVTDRATNPYTSVDDLLNRMVALVPPGPNVWGFRQEAFARFMCNLVTVRTDVWGIRGRVQLFRDNGIDPATGAPSGTSGNGIRDGNEEILSERQFYMVVDRSQRPIRVLLKRYLAE